MSSLKNQLGQQPKCGHLWTIDRLNIELVVNINREKPLLIPDKKRKNWRDIDDSWEQSMIE